jgi:hypothetical protein
MPENLGPADKLTLPNLLNAFHLAVRLLPDREQRIWSNQWRKHCDYFRRNSGKQPPPRR